MKRSQASIEFTLIMGVMFFVFIGFVAVTSSRMIQLQEERYYENLRETAEYTETELEIAATMDDGYTRQFDVPRLAFGKNYNITLFNKTGTNINKTFLLVHYIDFSVRAEFTLAMPANIKGNIYKGQNNLTKVDGTVCVNMPSCPT